MPIETAASLIQILDGTRLLGPEQMREAAQLQARFTEPRALAKELIQKGWLTPFQVNQVFQGKGKELVLGSYVLLERIGEGGMGNVYKARHLRLDKVVALKVIRKDRLTNAEAVGRFRREILLVAQLSHPNVVMAFDADFAAEGCYLSMEYVEGIDLAKLVRRNGPLPVPLAADYIKQAALGLQHAHERGLVHRDIKPSNLLVTSNGITVKLLDLGLARLRQDGEDTGQTFTQMGVVVGTPDFLSPEQARNAHTADIRSDLYSLGCTFYYLLTGQVLFPNKNATEKLFSQCFEAPKPVESLRPEVPANIAAVIKKLLAKKPEERYQTPAELAVALGSPPPAPVDRPSAATSAKPPGPAAILTNPLPPAMAAVAAPPTLAPTALPIPVAESAPTPPNHSAQTVLATPAASPWDRLPFPRNWLFPGAVGLFLFFGFVVLLFGLFRGHSTPPPSQSAGPGPAPQRPGMEVLDANSVPVEERLLLWQKDVVAVLGKQEHRHWGQVTGLAFSPDGKQIISGGTDHMVRFWDPTDLHVIRPPIKVDTSDIRALAVSAKSDALAVLTGDGTVRLWDIPTRERPWDKPRHFRSNGNYFANTIAFSPDGQFIATGDSGGGIRVWDVKSPEKPTILSNHKGPVTSVAFSRDGQTLASGGLDGSVQLLSVKDLEKEPIVIPRAHESTNSAGTTAIAFSQDSKTLASTGYDRTVRFWNVADGTKAARASLPQQDSISWFLTYSPDGKYLAFLNFGTIRIWDVSRTEPAEVSRLASQGTDVRSVAFGPDNRTLVSAGDNQVRLWDAVSRKELVPNTTKRPADIHAISFSHDGQMLVTGGGDRSLRVWEFGSVQPNERGLVILDTEGPIDAVAVTPDGKFVAAGGRMHPLRLWEINHAKPESPTRLPGHAGPVTSLAFSPDGKLLASGAEEPTAPVRLWAINGGKSKEKAALSGPRFGVRSVAFASASDGKRFATGSGDSFARIWEVDTEKSAEINCARRPSGVLVHDVALSPDGRRLATAASDQAVRIWDVTRAEPPEISVLVDSTFAATPTTYGLAYSPDGRLLAAAQDGHMTIWEVSSKRKVWEHELPGLAYRVAFAPDGRHLASVNGNGTVYIYRLPANLGK